MTDFYNYIDEFEKKTRFFISLKLHLLAIISRDVRVRWPHLLFIYIVFFYDDKSR